MNFGRRHQIFIRLMNIIALSLQVKMDPVHYNSLTDSRDQQIAEILQTASCKSVTSEQPFLLPVKQAHPQWRESTWLGERWISGSLVIRCRPAARLCLLLASHLEKVMKRQWGSRRDTMDLLV